MTVRVGGLCGATGGATSQMTNIHTNTRDQNLRTNFGRALLQRHLSSKTPFWRLKSKQNLAIQSGDLNWRLFVAL